MNAVVNLPDPVSRRGITEAQWLTMVDNLFPGAKPESVLMVWDYCAARKLDPLKKPCHIVPMRVKDARSDQYVWRDVVMPGIYEYRTTANRTGQYMGHSRPEYGPPIEHHGVTAPEWCAITIYRWNDQAKQRTEYPVQVFFRECAGTRKDSKTGQIGLNDRWGKAPVQMLTKCTEAAGLREAFPDELGGEHTAEEIRDDYIDHIPEMAQVTANPRGDLSNVDWSIRDKHVKAISEILAADAEEAKISDMLREYVAEYLTGFNDLYIAVADELAAQKIASKAQFKAWLKLGQEGAK
jgi:phage recombination protein Bet